MVHICLVTVSSKVCTSLFLFLTRSRTLNAFSPWKSFLLNSFFCCTLLKQDLAVILISVRYNCCMVMLVFGFLKEVQFCKKKVLIKWCYYFWVFYVYLSLHTVCKNFAFSLQLVVGHFVNKIMQIWKCHEILFVFRKIIVVFSDCMFCILLSNSDDSKVICADMTSLDLLLLFWGISLCLFYVGLDF